MNKDKYLTNSSTHLVNTEEITNTYVLDNLVITEIITNNLISGDNHIEIELSHINKSYSVFYIPNFKEKIRNCTIPLYEFLDTYSQKINNVEEFINNCTLETDIVFKFDIVFLNVKEELLPIPYYFDYICTPFHSDCLDLEKAKTKLEKHPWIKQVTGPHQVPYYNQNEENDKEYLEVIIYPDKEGFNTLYNTLKLKYKKPLHNIIDALHDFYCPTQENNILGLLDCVIEK